jgi:hypothetical protein
MQNLQNMYCPSCGTDILSTERFCSGCGISVPENQEKGSFNKFNVDAKITLDMIYAYSTAIILLWILIYLNQQARAAGYHDIFLQYIFESYFWFMLPLIILTLWQLSYTTFYTFSIITLPKLRSITTTTKALIHLCIGVTLISLLVIINTQMSTSHTQFAQNLWESIYWIFLSIIVIAILHAILSVLHLFSTPWKQITYTAQIIQFLIAFSHLLKTLALLFIATIYYALRTTVLVEEFQAQLARQFAFIELGLIILVALEFLQAITLTVTILKKI